MQLNAIKQMENYARSHSNVISLSQGIPFRQSDPSIRSEVISAILESKVDKYADPQGLVLLRQMLSHELQKEGMNYKEHEILVTAGAIEGITATLLTTITSFKDEVIIPTPTYSAYFRSVAVARGKSIFVKLNKDDDWSLDVEALKSKITSKTAAILLCNPNNPTGKLYSPEVLETLCQIATEKKIVLILDEVYNQMLYDQKTFYTPCVDERYKNSIVRIVSFSKDFSLTGWRVGFLHTSVGLLNKILPVHDAMINCVPVVSQYAALAALSNSKRILAENRSIYTTHRKLMKFYLDTLPDVFSYTMPEGAYFFFPKVRGVNDSQKFCTDLLHATDVAVVPGRDFGPGGEGHIRLCFGRSEEDIKNGMKKLIHYASDVLS